MSDTNGASGDDSITNDQGDGAAPDGGPGFADNAVSPTTDADNAAPSDPNADYDSATGMDWEACGVASIGGAAGAGAEVYFFEFRSQSANCRGQYAFFGAGVGLGGDLGGASAPSPSDVAHGTPSSPWTQLTCNRPFSGDDLNCKYAIIESATYAAAYGYSLCAISAGWSDKLFDSQNVSGWSVGVGISGSAMIGIWKRLGPSKAYY